MEDHRISAHLISIIFKLCRKELSILDPRQEDVITLPQVESGDLFIRNPLQCAFTGFELACRPVPFIFVDIIRFIMVLSRLSNL
jgi:hypothetical protein